MLSVKIKPMSQYFKMPKLGTEEAACFDLYYCDEERSLSPGEIHLFSLGFSVEFDKGWELLLRPRSGLAFKQGCTLLNSPAVIDSDYRGVVHALLINHSDEEVVFSPGMRICQGCFKPVHEFEFKLTEELGNTERGQGGFGSTGTH